MSEHRQRPLLHRKIRHVTKKLGGPGVVGSARGGLLAAAALGVLLRTRAAFSSVGSMPLLARMALPCCTLLLLLLLDPAAAGGHVSPMHGVSVASECVPAGRGLPCLIFAACTLCRHAHVPCDLSWLFVSRQSS